MEQGREDHRLVPAAYLGVILIWTTTPLAIKWSAEGSHFLLGVTGRMAIGAVVCWALMAWRRSPLPRDSRALRAYLVCGLGIYGGMTFAYWGVQFIPSGWLSVIFGLTPIFTGLMARAWLGESLSSARLVGMALGLGGLALIYARGTAFGPGAGLGIAAIVAASLCQSSSAVWLKRLGAEVPVLTLTTLGVTLTALLEGLTWAVSGLGWPAQVTPRAAWSILYLGVGGSVVGFLLYFYVLKRVEATKVALITLVTPVAALLIGRLFNDEAISMQVAWGTAAILAGLLVFQFGSRLPWLLRPSPPESGKSN
jgi:drug/metabolite transporter (DMT)-like permease